jgi:CBS domain-containing protein
MRARDLMTTDVVTVEPEASVRHIAQLMLRHRISAVPVVADRGKVVGIVSEGDLMRRPESGTERHRSWWLALLASSEDIARDYVRSHGRHAKDVMTTEVVAVDEAASISSIAALLEEKRIKRVLVLRDGRLVGVVSRSDLLHGLTAAKPEKAELRNEAIRREILSRIRRDAGVRDRLLNVVVADGSAHFWGALRSQAERDAARVAAETVGGVHSVIDHTTLLSNNMLSAN